MTKQVVAAAQLGPASETRTGTVARIVRLIREAADAGAALIVFPELALTPYFAAEIRDDAGRFFEATMPSPETWPIFDLAAARGIAVVLPFAELQGSTRFNSAVLIGEHGHEAGRYRKVHIPGHVEPSPDEPYRNFEKRYFSPGDLGFPVYPSPVGPLGILVCYDRRFPEAYRCCALAGAELIAAGYNDDYGPGATAQTAEAGQALSELAMRAGAYANGVFVIGAGKGGVEDGTGYIGGSVIIGPTGEILAKAKTDSDELVLAEIDREAAARVRERLNLALNRRPEHYQLLTRVPGAVY